MATVPASGPGPNTPTKSSAQTSEFTERLETSMTLAKRLSQRLCVMLCAARIDSGSASTIENNVPSVAMWKVSINASCTVSG